MSKAAKISTYRNRQIRELPKSAGLPLTTVVNITQPTPGIRWRYIGRAMPARKMQASRWANTFSITEDTPEARRAALQGYIMQLNGSGLIYHVADLRGDALGCWCHPKPCHGDCLAILANALRCHGGECPNCGNAVKSSPMARNEPGIFAEYWRCPGCGCWDFVDLGRLELLPP